MVSDELKGLIEEAAQRQRASVLELTAPASGEVTRDQLDDAATIFDWADGDDGRALRTLMTSVNLDSLPLYEDRIMLVRTPGALVADNLARYMARRRVHVWTYYDLVAVAGAYAVRVLAGHVLDGSVLDVVTKQLRKIVGIG